MAGGKPKRTMNFHIDELMIFKYMEEHEIRTLMAFLEMAGIKYDLYNHCQKRGYITLETAWKLAEFMGVMIEDIIIAEKIEEEK